ncbi:bacillithiol system redox-active protein YtxJ [Pseudozobellia sp. WGM2]|uniref:bacillithiol system redox-active protein YtxJ n=1 Tax=Pseudozobellia sp. WGM2 TaxID=2787625 RepID=UPI001AE0439A|nr:bacillithiol system redox-active protein YtxJ [Pseudozobellia sp. WGM2]
MGLFSGLFGGGSKEENEEKTKIPWIALTHISQLDEIVEKSMVKPQVIFKHSTTCGISRMVLNMFTSNYALSEEQMDFYFIDLHKNRNVSNEVETKFNIVHQSPQLLIIKNAQVVAHDSHGAISELRLEEFV